MMYAHREDDRILIRTGEKTWKSLSESEAQGYVTDIVQALSQQADPSKGLAYYREQEGLTQQELADIVGVRRTYISQIECGEADGLTLKTANRIASVLNCPLRHL